MNYRYKTPKEIHWRTTPPEILGKELAEAHLEYLKLILKLTQIPEKYWKNT